MHDDEPHDSPRDERAPRTFGFGLCSTGKYRYDTRPAADRAVHGYARQARTGGRDARQCSVYRCEACHGWHLGSAVLRRRRRRR